MSEKVKALVNICKEFVRSMYRTEEAVSTLGDALSADEMREALKEVLGWIQDTDEIPDNSFTKEVAREIIGQLSGIIVLKDYKGSADYYIA